MKALKIRMCMNRLTTHERNAVIRRVKKLLEIILTIREKKQVFIWYTINIKPIGDIYIVYKTNLDCYDSIIRHYESMMYDIFHIIINTDDKILQCEKLERIITVYSRKRILSFQRIFHILYI